MPDFCWLQIYVFHLVPAVKGARHHFFAFKRHDRIHPGSIAVSFIVDAYFGQVQLERIPIVVAGDRGDLGVINRTLINDRHILGHLEIRDRCAMCKAVIAQSGDGVAERDPFQSGKAVEG